MKCRLPNVSLSIPYEDKEGGIIPPSTPLASLALNKRETRFFKWYKIYIVYRCGDISKLIIRFLLTIYHFGDIIDASLK